MAIARSPAFGNALTQAERDALDWAHAGYPETGSSKYPKRLVYPLTSEEVVTALRERGLDVDIAGLHEFIVKAIAVPERVGEAEYRWSASDIEAVAEHLNTQYHLSGIHLGAYMEGYDPLQEQLALYCAWRRTRIRDAIDLVMICLPDPAVQKGSRRRLVVYVSPSEFENDCNAGLSRLIQDSLAESSSDLLMERYSQHLKAERL